MIDIKEELKDDQKSTESKEAVVKQKKTTKSKSKNQLQFEKDTSKVKGRFKNNINPGEGIQFFFLKYKEVPLERYSFKDGEIVEVPYMVARHLNNNCYIPIHKRIQDEDGNWTRRIGEKVHKFSFESLGLFNEEDNDLHRSNIVTVERG